MNRTVPRRLSRADRAKPLPPAVAEVLDASPADAWDRIERMTRELDEDERSRVLALVCERLGLVRE